MPMKLALWDFDGTLAHRAGMWSGTLVEVAAAEAPHLSLSIDDIRGHLRTGFPWNRPDEPHPHLADADAWWAALHPYMAAAYERVGVPSDTAAALATKVRERYLALDAWRVFDDVTPALEWLTAAGWRHVIVSNHTPELADLVDGLGIGGHFLACVNSAVVGYEKPRREIYEAALAAGPGASQVVMVGDNPVADVQGAAGAGIPGLLLDRQAGEPVLGAFRSLAEVADALLAGQWQPHAPVAAARRG